MSYTRASQTQAALTDGYVLIHSAPMSLARHIEWALNRVMSESQPNRWTAQPAEFDSVRTEFYWQGEPGSGALLASELAGWQQLRFEVTEHASAGHEAARFMFTPSLGMHHSAVDPAGNLLVGEFEIQAAIAEAGAKVTALRARLRHLLATDWDEELEPFRSAAEGSPVRWISKVG